MRLSRGFLLSAGIGAATIGAVTLSCAQDLLPARDMTMTSFPSPVSCSEDHGGPLDGSCSPSSDIRLADDYCNARCERQFDYCRYRNEPWDRCAYELAHCRARC